MIRTRLLLATTLLGLAGAFATTHAQDDAVTAKLKALDDKSDSPQKLQSILSLEQTEGLTGKQGTAAREMYRNTLFSLYKGDAQRKQIVDGLQAIVDATPDIDKDDANEEAAQVLIDKQIHSQDAATFARAAIRFSDENHANELKQMQQKMASARAQYLSAMGQAYLLAGDRQQAQQTLADAFAVIPLDDNTAEALAKISEDAGNHQAAADYLLPDVLSGTASDEITKMLADIYTRMHGNSSVGYAQWLDEAYVKNEEKVLTVTKFSGTLPPNPRTVLVELFGSATCNPCDAADMAADAQLKRYPNSNAVLLMYHENIPRPDPMTSAETDARGDFYKIDATPRMYVDGYLLRDMGGDQTHAAAAFATLQAKVDSELSRSTPAKLQLTGSLAASTVTGQLKLSGLSDSDDKLVVQIVLVENQIHFVGANGSRVQQMVVRDFANGGLGFVYKGTENETYPFIFDVKARDAVLKKYLANEMKTADKPFTFDDELLPINPQRLSLVAFVQNVKTREILQTTYLPLATQ